MNGSSSDSGGWFSSLLKTPQKKNGNSNGDSNKNQGATRNAPPPATSTIEITPETKIKYRPLDYPADKEAMFELLRQGLDLPDVMKVKLNPRIARYVKRQPASGIVATTVGGDASIIGGAWLLTWTEAEGGHNVLGWVDDDTPVLVMSVATAARGRGIGTALLTQLFDEVQQQSNSYNGISLSVRKTNAAACHLYQKMGFVTIIDDDTDETYDKMIRKL